MRNGLIFLLFFISLAPCQSQQNNTWYFGDGAGLSFNAGGPSIPYALTDGINNSIEGSASVSDDNGNILFYTNGETIYNRLHAVMLNGNSIGGHYSAVQAAVIVRAVTNDSLYYVFTTDADEHHHANGYRYSIVNMARDGGNGEVISKNILLSSSCTERLTVAAYANGMGAWVIGNEKNSNIFKAWLVNCNGVQPTPVVSAVGEVLTAETYGTMKVSPDGTQLCQTGYPHFDAGSNFFQLFYFDNATGVISNARVINIPDGAIYGCEFSPDSKLIYLTNPASDIIYQLETKLSAVGAIFASRVDIPAIGGLYTIQTGPDKKIYLTYDKSWLAVISNPNVKGIGCTFEPDKISLSNRVGQYGLPSAVIEYPVYSMDYLITQISPGQTINAGETAQLFVSGGGTHYQWSPPQSLNNPNIQNPVAKPGNDITYIVSVSNDFGCKAVDSVIIHVNSSTGLYVPTGFTPGNNGLNDVFRPLLGNEYALEEFSVYNRWGQKVFSTNQRGKGWDGKINGQIQAAGIFAWFLKVTGPLDKKIEKKGTVNLIQ